MTAIPRPTVGRIQTFAHDGLSFDVIDDGPLDGPPVVLLHGFPSVPRTGRASRRCSTRRGCARSPRTSAATPREPARAVGWPTG